MSAPGRAGTLPAVAGSAPALAVAGLAKSFGPVRAVDGISFEMGRGELLGLLGPNGAGKSTTIAMLTGLARPDAGSIRVGGADALHGAVGGTARMSPAADLGILAGFCALLFLVSMGNVKRRWIA